jgi:rhamnulokinase
VIASGQMRDRRALVAIDLGAESCRVSLLRWQGDEPEIELIHRVPNGPVFNPAKGENGELRWPLDMILSGIEEGLRKAAAAAPEGIRSIAVDGWAVDYVRLGEDAKPQAAPFCYRDVRTESAKAYADALLPPKKLFSQTGAQPLRINTLYQLLADAQTTTDDSVGVGSKISREAPWILLPEYLLFWLGGQRVAEYTNATHTGLVDLQSGQWSVQLFKLFGLDIAAAPPIVATGSVIGKVSNNLKELAAFADTDLIAPACHDTASAIAAVNQNLAHTAYIVSGTWSLVGTVIEDPITTKNALNFGFTNQGAATGGFCFHTNINGMWLLKQCLDHWQADGRNIELPALIAQAAQIEKIPTLLNVDVPTLMLAGRMPERINYQLESYQFEGIETHTIPDEPGNEPVFARLIFASLAARYVVTLRNLEALTGRSFQKIVILGGGSRNVLLRRLTEESTGLPVVCGEAEGSTIGNFAVQLAAEGNGGPSREAIRAWAARLTKTEACGA